MQIGREAVQPIVKAARMAMKLANDLHPILMDKHGQTWADEIFGQLADTLFIMSKEKLQPNQNFNDSNTMMMLRSDNSDGAVADWFIMMDKIRKRVNEPEEVRQPAPQIMNPAETEKLRKQNGGYGFFVPVPSDVKPV